jgi:CubicO group peptidase (beta-lactamase class C family)
VTGSTLFDLASITKIAATTPALMKLYDEAKFRLDDPVRKFVPAFSGGEKDRVTIRNLLAHQSGLPAYRDFYHFCTSPTQLLDSLYATPLVTTPGDSTIYSDLGMMILGKVVEAISGLPFDEYVRRNFFSPLGMTNTMFLPPDSRRENTAPTEDDRLWRRQVVQGKVHDENAELLGGISGHAGLFSTASDLSVFVQLILNGGTYGGKRYVRESTVFEFTTRQRGSSSRGLGWDLKSAQNSTAGSLFSAASFGHTGFTGGTVWIDPERKLAVIFLTNRVYPTRENMRINRVRPKVHDTVVRALVESP